MNTENNKSNAKKRNLFFLALLILLSMIVIMQTFVILNFKLSDNSVKADNTQCLFDNKVETPVADLILNLTFVDNLRAEIRNDEDYSVVFKVDTGDNKDIELLTIYFDNNTNGTNIGTFKDKNDNLVDLSVYKNNLGASTILSKIEIENLVNLQIDLIDSIISNLEFVYYAEITEPTESENPYICIDTPYTELKYPKKWEDNLKVNIYDGEPYKVEFLCVFDDYEPVVLFSYILGGESEIPIGVLNGVQIGVTLGDDEANVLWTDEEKEVFYSMREDFAAIADELIEIDGFIIN